MVAGMGYMEQLRGRTVFVLDPDIGKEPIDILEWMSENADRFDTLVVVMQEHMRNPDKLQGEDKSSILKEFDTAFRVERVKVR